MQIIKISEENILTYLDEIVNIHFGSYDDKHFTSKFGKQDLNKYYELLIKYSDLTIVAIDENENCLGFIISGYNVSQGIQEFIAKNKLLLISIMFKNPQFLFEKIYNMTYSKLYPSEPSCAQYRLLSISVSKLIQSSGVGHFLLTEFEEELKIRNIDLYGLSVRNVNHRAIRFYKNNDFIKEKQYMKSDYFFKRIIQEKS